jgi:branched-chain amino acid transport system permease protein
MASSATEMNLDGEEETGLAGNSGSGIGVDAGRRRIVTGVVIAALFLAAAAGPFVLTGYWVRVLSSVWMYAALASSLNIIVGYAGYADFGNIVYFGIGAYTTGILMRAGVPLPLAMLAGGVLCAVFAALLGLPILRLRGNYFAIATFGVTLAVRELSRNMSITGGGVGMSVPILRVEPKVFNGLIYAIMFVLMAAVVTISYIVSRRRFGYGLRAIKADETGAAVMGIDTTRHKMMAWSLSALCTGTVGGAYAFWITYFSPPDVFNTVNSLKYLVMIYLGGVGTVLGPVVGALVLELVSNYVWGEFLGYHLGVLGAAVIMIVLFMPRGLLAVVRTKLVPAISRVTSQLRRS